VVTVIDDEAVTDSPEARTIPPPPPPPPDGVEPFDIPPPPPPATTRTSTEETDDGTVHERVANPAPVVGVVAAVAKESTQSPFDATAMVTPVASSTVAVHVPLVTVAACAGEARKVDETATTEKAKRPTVPMSDSVVRARANRLNTSKSYS
jgi:hypothetical protein